MAHVQAKTAKDRSRNRVKVGDRILYVGYGEVINIPPAPVTVLRIHCQGKDGTILTCDKPPKPEYPNHFTCRASVVERVPVEPAAPAAAAAAVCPACGFRDASACEVIGHTYPLKGEPV